MKFKSCFYYTIIQLFMDIFVCFIKHHLNFCKMSNDLLLYFIKNLHVALCQKYYLNFIHIVMSCRLATLALQQFEKSFNDQKKVFI